MIDLSVIGDDFEISKYHRSNCHVLLHMNPVFTDHNILNIQEKFHAEKRYCLPDCPPADMPPFLVHPPLSRADAMTAACFIQR